MSGAPDPKPTDQEELPDESYLWDRTGPADPGLVDLERLLAPLAHDAARPLRWTEDRPRVRRLPWVAGGVCGVVALAAALALWLRASPDQPTRQLARQYDSSHASVFPTAVAPPSSDPNAALTCASGAAPSAGFAFESLQGAPTCDGAPAAARGQLPTGTWLETDSASRVKLEVANIGHVEIDPSSRLRVVSTRPDEHRLELARGGLKAKIDAPPRLFFVDTKAATAVDLGCEYELHVDERGAGMLKVTLGFVELERPASLGGAPRKPALVPRNAQCTIDPGRGPGTPVWSRTAVEVREALAKFDATGDSDALSVVLDRMTDRDSLTLFHLLDRVPEAQRGRVLDLLEKIAPRPLGVSRNATLNLEPRAIAAWRATLERRWFPK